MYCPKCGRENAETNKYCHTCRENLSVISQAMKQRLPVLIASRLDQILDSRSERFRRDSVLYIFIGISYLVDGVFRLYDPFPFILACLFFLSGVWAYLAYRRSQEPNFDWGDSNEEASGIGIGDYHIESDARTTNKMNS